MVIREIRENEIPLLTEFLYEAIFQRKGRAPVPGQLYRSRALFAYIEWFGQKQDDCCLVAEEQGHIVGAVWVRCRAGGFGFVDENTPELAVSVYAEYRGCGIGTALVESILTVLKDKGYRQVSLSVQKDNGALRIYRKTGFQTVGETEEEYIMVCMLQGG